MGLAVGVYELFSIFVSIIICFVTLPENMTVVNAVPAGTDIKLIDLMLLIMHLKMSTVFVLQFILAQNSLLFSSHGFSGCSFPPLNLLHNLAYQLQICYQN